MHFVKFMNALLVIMDLYKNLKGNYLTFIFVVHSSKKEKIIVEGQKTITILHAEIVSLTVLVMHCAVISPFFCGTLNGSTIEHLLLVQGTCLLCSDNNM